MRKYLVVIMSMWAAIVSAQTSVAWQSLGNATDENGAYYIQRFTVRNAKGVERLCFNQFARPMQALNQGDEVHEIIPGYYYITSEGFENDSVVIDRKSVV